MNNRLLQRTALLALGFCLLLLIVGTADACPTCKEALAGDKNQENMVQSYFWSILFMMSMPFSILAGLGGYFFYLHRKARLQHAVDDRAPEKKSVIELPAVSPEILASVTNSRTTAPEPVDRILS